MEKMHDLAYSQEPDGAIRLLQIGYCGEESIIDMHPAQLRHIAEHFGLVAPAPPADDLTKRLAEQLGRVFLDMSDDYRHLTHTLEFAFARIDGFLETLPDDVFPAHLWDERDERERQRKEQEEARQAAREASRKQPTQEPPEPPASPPDGLQMDLAV